MLYVEKLSKSFDKRLISNFTYKFEKGKIYAICGTSGSGKSTLLNILSGLNKSYKGNVYFDGKNIKNLSDYTLKDVSYVYQNHQLFNNLTVLENILIPFEIIKKDTIPLKNKIKELLNYFDINHLINNKVKDLSGGEKQRVAIIRAILKDPKVLLLDEPTSALDKNNKDKLIKYLNILKKDKIIILVTHDIDLAQNCDIQIQINKNYHVFNHVIINKGKKEKRIKISNSKKIQKNVFKFNKFFSYMASSITSFALICICLCEILSSFINSVISSSFSSINTENDITLMSHMTDENIDFTKQLHAEYSHIHYQGIRSDIKQQIKQTVYIENVYLNDYRLLYTTFIFDNYLSEYDEEVVLYVSQVGALKVYENNYLYIHFNGKVYQIKIDKVYVSPNDIYSIHCNNLNYLNSLLNDINIKIEYENFLYSNNSNELYEFLINDKKYLHYNFNLIKNQNIIHYYKNSQCRMTKKDVNYYINKYDIEYYIYSDYSSTYIDFDSGLSYVIIEKNPVQVVIDNTLEDECINVSIKYQTQENKVIIDNRTLLIKSIVNENNFEIIYMNHNTFNRLNKSENMYVVLLHCKQKINNDLKHVIINDNLFSFTDIKAFKYIVFFIMVYGIIISILSIISLNVIFDFNIINKKRDINVLINLGVYKSKIISLLLYEPIEIINSSIVSALFSYVAIKIMTTYIYYSISMNILTISFSYNFIFLLCIVPYFIIMFPLIKKIKKYIKK